MPIDLLLTIPQALHALASLGEWVRETKRRRMVEQSTEGEAMATKVEVQRNHSTGVDTHVVEGEPEGLSRLVNEAIKANDKFVTFSVPGGKKLSVVAERVEAMWEE